MLISLLQNVALLIALVVVYQLFFHHWRTRDIAMQSLWGALFGVVAMVSMMTPFVFAPGVVIDGRSIILSVAGFFGGPVVALVATLFAGSYRLHMGGAGVWAGLGVILSSSLIGVIFHYLRKIEPPLISLARLWIFGLVVHLAMIVWLGFVPEVGAQLVRETGFYVVAVFPLATVVVCRIFLESEQKLAMQNRLEESEQQLQSLMSHLPGMVYRCRDDAPRTREFVSEGCLALTGYSAEELLMEVGGNSFNLVHEEDAPRIRTETVEALRERRRFLLQYRIKTRDGKLKYVEDRGRGIFDETGRAVMLEGFILDVTDRHQAEEERRRLEEALLQAMKLQAVGRLAGGVAHDFNNMLSVINGYTDLAMKELQGNPKALEYLTDVKVAGEKSAKLTQQLLAFARKQPIQPRTLELNEALKNRVEMLKRLIGENIELVATLEGEVGCVQMDPVQLDQILVNLVINARDAIGTTGKISIHTRTFELSHNGAPSPVDGMKPGPYVTLSIADTGRGMEPETLRHLFEPFYTTKARGEGTGLGLATVYGILSQNQAHIAVDSKPDEGTCFTVYFPKATAHSRDGSPPSPPGPSPGHASGTLLLVEDETPILKLSSLYLQRIGYKVLEAGGPDEALRIFETCQDPVDLLVTDVIMPGMDGFSLWKKLSAKKPLRCLFISGYTADIIHRHGILLEDVHFLEKPFTMEALATKVAETIHSPVDDQGQTVPK